MRVFFYFKAVHYTTLSEELNSPLRSAGHPIFAGKVLTLYDMIYGCNVKELVSMSVHLSVLASFDTWENHPPEKFTLELIAFSKKMGKFYLPSTAEALRHYLAIGDPKTEEGDQRWRVGMG